MVRGVGTMRAAALNASRYMSPAHETSMDVSGAKGVSDGAIIPLGFPRGAHGVSQGLAISSPMSSKSLMLRVATPRP